MESRDKIDDNHYLIKILKWAEKKTDGFTYNELIESQKFNEQEISTINRYFSSANHNAEFLKTPSFSQIPETIFHAINHDRNDYKSDTNKYVLTVDSLFRYIDYEELKLARKTSEEARVFSSWSIRIAIIAIIISIIMPIIISSRSTKVEISENQFNEFKLLIDKKNK